MPREAAPAGSVLSAGPCSFQYFHHFAFLAFATAFFIRMHFHAVAMQSLSELAWCDVDVIFKFVFWHDECGAIGRHIYPAYHESLKLLERIFAFFYLFEEAGTALSRPA